MLSKTLLSALVFTSAVSASPALRNRRSDPCKDAYNACIAAGTSQVACSCTLTSCSGEDNARNREYCSSATANLPTTTSAASSSSAAATYACNPAHSYPNGASCVSTNGALSLVTPSASATSYACNPAHSYPNGASCVSTNGALSLVTPSASATSYACNPAHSYPNGASCVSTNGALSLVTPSASATSYACNPAHSYPNGAACVSTNGALSLVTPTASSTVPASSANTQVPVPTAASGASPKKVGDKTWSILDLTRYCGDGNTGCDYNFKIEADGKTEACTIVQMPGSNAATENWSNQPCTEGSSFHVSWGYVENPAPAYAVMTVVGPQGTELAWFGVSNVNGQEVTPSNPFGSGQYGNLGPEPVYTYNN